MAILGPFLDDRRLGSSDRTRAHFLMGWISSRLGRHQQASAHFFRVRRLGTHPLSEFAAFYEASSDLARGHPSTALAECDKLVEAWPHGRFVEECRLLSGRAWLDKGSRTRAAEVFDAFLADHPDDQRREEISLLTAAALEEAGEFERAAQTYRYLYISHQLPTTGREAAEALQRLEAWGVELPPLNDNQLYARACSLRTSGQHDASYDLFCELDDRNPGQGESATALGRQLDSERHDFLWRNRQFDQVGIEAAARYDRDPSAAGAARDAYLAMMGFAKAGRWKEAVKYQELGRSRFPSDGNFRRTEERSALLHIAAQDYPAAVKDWEAWMARSSQARRSTRNRFLLAYTRFKAKDYAGAASALAELTRSSGRYGEASKYWLGRTYERQKRWRDARALFAELKREDPDGWYTLLLANRERREAGGSGSGRGRNGRWPGLSRAATPVAVPPARMTVAESQARGVAALARTVDAPLPLPGPPRDADGRFARPVSDGWSRDSLFGPPAERLAVDRAPGTVERDAVPTTWATSPWWDPVQAGRLWKTFASDHAELWPDLPAAYELSLIGLGEVAGPMLAQIYGEIRDTRRSKSRKRAVSRWRSAGGAGGSVEVQRWAAILDVSADSDAWRQIFAAAGYPASVSAFATESIRYSGLDRDGGDGRAAWTLRFPAAFGPHVWRAGWSSDVDPLLMLSIMRAESLYKHDAVSRVGALGLVQVMPATGAKVAALMGRGAFRPDQLLVPEHNIALGTWYLGRLLDRFPGQFPLAVGSYNGGPHNIGRWLRGKVDMPFDEFVEEIAFDETRHYIKKVVGYYGVYTHLYTDGDWVELPGETQGDFPDVINF